MLKFFNYELTHLDGFWRLTIFLKSKVRRCSLNYIGVRLDQPTKAFFKMLGIKEAFKKIGTLKT